MKELRSRNKELIRNLSAKLGVPEEKVPSIVHDIFELIKYDIGKFTSRRSFLSDLMLGAGIATGLAAASSPASARLTLTDKYIQLDDEKFYPSSVGPYSAIVYKDGSKVKAEDWRGKLITQGEAGVDDAEVIQSALNSLTAGRTWKERVILKGVFEVDTPVNVPSFTILEVQGKLRSKDGLNLYAVLVKNAEHVDINIKKLDGNAAGQSDGTFPECPYGLHIWSSKWVTIRGHYYNAYRENIHIYQCENVFLDVFVERSAHYEGVAITGESDNPCKGIIGKIISKDNALAGVHTHHYCYDIDFTIIDNGSKYGLDIWKTTRSRFRVISVDAKEYGVSLNEATDCKVTAIIKNATSFGLNAYKLIGCKLDVISLNSGDAGLHFDDSSDCKIFAYAKESGGRGIEGGNNHRNKIEGYVISNNGNGFDFWGGSSEKHYNLGCDR